MEFIALIIALAIERYIHIDSYIFRFNWFKSYMDLMQNVLGKTGMFNGVIALICLIAPVILVVGIVYYLLASIAWGLVGFILATLILIYCLGPRDLYTNFEAYFIAVVRDDKNARESALKNILCVMPENENEEARELTKSVFSHFIYNLFSVAFWFLIFGPLAAVFYRTVAEIHKQAHTKDSPYESMLPSATCLLNIIDWIPVRIASLGFLLMGDFHQGFSYWIKNIASSMKENYKFIQEMGLASMGLLKNKSDSGEIAEVKSALKLTDRTLVLFVVVVALFVLGAIIY